MSLPGGSFYSLSMLWHTLFPLSEQPISISVSLYLYLTHSLALTLSLSHTHTHIIYVSPYTSASFFSLAYLFAYGSACLPTANGSLGHQVYMSKFPEKRSWLPKLKKDFRPWIDLLFFSFLLFYSNLMLSFLEYYFNSCFTEKLEAILRKFSQLPFIPTTNLQLPHPVYSW